jgi:hypothetical protein
MVSSVDGLAGAAAVGSSGGAAAPRSCVKEKPMMLTATADARNGSVASDVVEAMSASVETVEWSLGNTDL